MAVTQLNLDRSGPNPCQNIKQNQGNSAHMVPDPGPWILGVKIAILGPNFITIWLRWIDIIGHPSASNGLRRSPEPINSIYGGAHLIKFNKSLIWDEVIPPNPIEI